jgi:2-iminobutanoate/2-iminopropanoate deaminase
MTEKHVVNVPGVKTIGPYSQAVRSGGLLFVSGQPGVDPATGQPAGPDFATQLRQVFSNLEEVLKAGGSSLELVVNTTVLVTDIANFPAVNAAFAEHFPVDPPARMTMQVPLPSGLLLSIGCVAAIAGY